MKRIIFFLLIFLSVNAYAQSVQKLYPQVSPNGKSFVDVSDSSSTYFIFTFPGAGVTGSGQNNSYSGYCEIICWADSISTAVDSATTGDRDSLWVSVYPLFHDANDLQLEMSSDADMDSLDIKNDYNWGSNHSDDRYTFNVTTNLPPCEGFRVNVYTGANGRLKIRFEARIAESKTF